MNRFVFNPSVLPYLARGGGGVRTGLQVKALKIASKARELAPVGETGRLRESIKVSISEEGGRIAFHVGTNVPYARFQEFGTVYVPATEFLEKALEE